MSSQTVRWHLLFAFAMPSKRPVLVHPRFHLNRCGSVCRADPHGFHDTPKAGDKTITFLEEFASECRKLGVELFGLTHHEYTEIKQVV